MKETMNVYTYDSRPRRAVAVIDGAAATPDYKPNHFYLDEPANPTKIFYIGDSICIGQARLVDTLRRNAGCDSGVHAIVPEESGSHSFDAAYERIMQENWPFVSQYASQMAEIARDSAGSYRMWDVEVRCDNALEGVFAHMQPTLGKVYRGALGRYGVSIVLENGKPLCLRDGDFTEVRVVRPRFTIAW